MRWFIRWLFAVVVVSAMPAALPAQDAGITQRQQERIQAKKEKEKKKEKARKEKEDRKRHLSIQDKATRKRLKRNTRRADRGGPGPHRDPFLKRLFSR